MTSNFLRRLIAVPILLILAELCSLAHAESDAQRPPKHGDKNAARAQDLVIAVSADGSTTFNGRSQDESGVGACWVFTRGAGVWTQQGGKLVGSGAVGASLQGASIALSAEGNTALVGGPGDHDGVGAAWVFTRSDGVWTQQGEKLAAAGITGKSRQGITVKLSPDGNTAQIGGYSDGRKPVSVTWVFTRKAGVWTQQNSKAADVASAAGAQQENPAAPPADNGSAASPPSNPAPTDISSASAQPDLSQAGGTNAQQGNSSAGGGSGGGGGAGGGGAAPASAPLAAKTSGNVVSRGEGTDVPTASSQTLTTAFNTALTITLTGTDPGMQPLTINMPTSPAHGVLNNIDLTAGTVTYTPTANFQGSDSFTFTVTNGMSTSAPATISITVTPGTPMANAQAVNVPLNTATPVTLTGTDQDSPALTLTYSLTLMPSHGALSGSAPNYTYTPTSNYFGSDSFAFTVNNGTNTSSAATVSITVEPDSPTANAQTVNVVFGTATPITLTGNDPNTPPLTLTYAVTSQPSNGTLSGTAPNVSYTPNAGYSGADSFTFTDSNGTNSSNTATVTIAVAAGTPVANAQSLTTTFNTPLNFTLTGTDPDAPPQTLTFNTPTAPSNGSLSVVNSATGAVTYTPNLNFQGSDSFTFTVSNGTNTSNAATVSITVAPGTPVANVQIVNAAFGTVTAITLTGTDPDIPALALSYTITAQPTHGTLSGSAPNESYTPNAGYSGPDSFTFTVSNGTNTSTAATVTINVGIGTPAANAQTVGTEADTPKFITLTATDPDIPALTLTFNTPTAPSNGMLSGFDSSTGAVTYTPNAGFVGFDSFTFTVTNGTNTSTAATITIVIAPGTPTANPQMVNAAFNTVTAITLTGSDPDVPALPLSFIVTVQPLNGIVSGSGANVVYTPNNGYNGSDSFMFTASNGVNTSTAATVTITVAPGTPTATAQSVTAAFETALPITLTGTDPDIPALTLTFNTPTAPANGALSLFNPVTGTVTYTPNNGFYGSDSFTFTVTNSSLNTSAPATVSITVLPGTPTVNAQSLTTAVATPVNFTLTGSDPDNPALPLTFEVGTPANGSITNFNASAGTGTYTPTGTYSGADSFTFTASNGTHTSASATVSITINPLTIETLTLPGGTMYVSYSQSISVDAAPGQLTYTLQSGALPDSLALNSGTGQITGQPTNLNSGNPFAFTIQVADTDGNSVTQAYSVTIAAPTIAVNPSSLNALKVGVAFSEQLSASGGLAAYTFSLANGSTLPAGLTLNVSGVLHGTPTQGGSFSFIIQATDATLAANGGPFSGTTTYTPTIAAATIVLAPASPLPDAAIAAAYSQQVSATGGTAPYTFSVSSGALPAGLQLDLNSGMISGTPTAGGGFSFTIKAVDSSTGTGPYNGTLAYTLNVAPPTIVITPDTLPTPTVGVLYSQSFAASGGTAPYTFSVFSGTLPSGLMLSSDGTLSGTPTSSAAFSFIIQATDSSTGAGPYSATANYSTAVEEVPVFISGPTASFSSTAPGVGVTFSATTNSPNFVVTWDFGDGSPTATGLNVGHVFTAAGIYTITVTATNPVTLSTVTQTLTETVTQENSFPNTTAIQLCQGVVTFGATGDTLTLLTELPLTSDPAGAATLTVTIGGYTQQFALDSTGHGSASTGGISAQVSAQHISLNENREEVHVYLAGNLKTLFGTNVTVDTTGRPVTMVVVVQFNGTTYSNFAPLSYTTTVTTSTARFGFVLPYPLEQPGR